MNASGQVTGYAYTTGNAVSHAFLSGANGGALTDLGTLGGMYSYGTGVNASGQVTGISDTTGYSAQHAFFYSGGVLSDLNDLIAPGSGFTTLVYAASISDTGYITGYGIVTNGETHAFLLTLIPASNAVPEPSTLASLGTGLVVSIGFLLRRRRRIA